MAHPEAPVDLNGDTHDSLIDLFRVIKGSPAIEEFYRSLQVQAKEAGEEALVTIIAALLQASVAQRYNAYSTLARPEKFEANMAKAVDTIGLLLAEEEIGEEPKDRVVYLSPFRTRISSANTQASCAEYMRESIVRAANILKAGGKNDYNQTHLDELLNYRGLPLECGLRVKFDILGMSRNERVPDHLNLNHSAITIYKPVMAHEHLRRRIKTS